MLSQNKGLIPTAFTAAVNRDFTNTPRPARIVWESYGRPEYGDKATGSPLHRKIDGHISYNTDHIHIEGISGEEYIIAKAENFAPSKGEFYGKEIVNEFENPEQELPPTPFENEGWVIGKLEDDVCTGIGVNVVVLRPDDETSNIQETRNVADLVSQSIDTLNEFDHNGKEHALETVDETIKTLEKVKQGIQGEYKTIHVTGIPQDKNNTTTADFTFTHE